MKYPRKVNPGRMVFADPVCPVLVKADEQHLLT
jgi:hypothetical protein